MTDQIVDIFCPLDTPSLETAKDWAGKLAGHVGGMKIGLEFFNAQGPQGVKAITDMGMPLFLDLKFHDIPNTVAGAVAAATPLAPYMMNVHAAGGPAMMKAARQAAEETSNSLGITRPLVIGVTVLTSLDDDDLTAIGVSANTADQVVRLARLTQACGLDGVVCSSHEIVAIRDACGPDFKLVVPGIRLAGSDMADQKRIMTPPDAARAGANHLVIGRPITQAPDPVIAAEKINESLANL
ncbi:MAG: orotidine-5'-phosphate decarboxylase [Alphaproteobacteria bacterium]|nr:MAG: orotidine-5'-phosphate decarboxylase [Alphaproteobacteria bacterium]